MREERKRQKIFFENPGRGKKDGHFGAHGRGDKRGLTRKSGSREWGVVEEQRELEGREGEWKRRRNSEESEESGGTRRRGGGEVGKWSGVY